MKCELCKKGSFRVYKYPTNIKPFLIRFFRTAIRLRPFQALRNLISTIKGLKLFKNKLILVCEDCLFGVVFPKIEEQKLTNYYQKEYWVSQGKIEPCESNRTISTYKLLQPYIKGEVLEFGSASAQLSRFFKTRKYKTLFDSVDLGLKWENELKKYVRNTYTSLDLVEGKYNLIMASHSLEHIPHLEAYFHKFKKLLKKNGYLYFEVPNCEEKIVFLKDFHFPHTYFFTPTSFRKIAKKFKLKVKFIKTFAPSYSQRFNKEKTNITSMQENPKGSYLRVLLQNENN